MPRDLFGDVTRPSISIGNRKWYTVPVSLLSHTVVIAMIVIVPILAAPYMPDVMAGAMPDYVPIADPPTPPPIKPKLLDHQPPPNPDAAPLVPPDGIAPEPLEPFEAVVANPGVIGGDEHIDRVLTPPPPVAVAPPPKQDPVRIGGTIRQPVKLRGNDPVYPTIAQAARVQGIVIIEATLGADGRVMNARILRSVPLLDQAALEAVRTWEYTPTTLNGAAVPVVMTVTVTFTLSR
jgi:periplasmic protein TonB